MSFAITLSFPTGRFHATHWSQYVNNNRPEEWPISPWRLLRALVAVWKRKLSNDPLLSQSLVEAIFAQLTTPPMFKLPPATLGNTRHYMPIAEIEKNKQKTTGAPVLDTFVVLHPEAKLGFLWAEASLSLEELKGAERLLSHLHYLGRAESVCMAEVCLNWSDLSGAECKVAQMLDDEALREELEPVRVLCADPKEWNKWGYSKKKESYAYK